MDTRFTRDAGGLPRGLNWPTYGLTNPERPVVDPGVGDPLTPPKSGISTDWRDKASYTESQSRGAKRGGQSRKAKA